MAVCRILKGVDNWTKGNLVEIFGSQLEEMFNRGEIEVVVPDVKVEAETKLEVAIEVLPKRGRRKKGVK